MLKRKKLIAVAAVCLTAVVSIFGCAKQNEYIYDPYQNFWDTNLVQNETVVFALQEDGSISGNLIFSPTKVISVKNYTLESTYDKSEYRLEGNKIIATDKSTMPYMTPGMLTGEEKKDIFAWGPYDTGYVFTEGIGIIMHHVAVTYEYNADVESWNSKPVYQGDKLLNSMAKLEKGEEINVFLFGDSISAGGNASSSLSTAPYLPKFGNGVCMELEERFKTKVNFYNGSVGGWVSAQGAGGIDSAFDVATNTYSKAPDLAIIGFGMNDASHKVPVSKYKQNIKTIIESIREKNPDCDIVIISTIHAAPQSSQDKSIPPLYAAEDKDLCSTTERCANVDMTSFSMELYKTKKGVDILANNINHPSDFLVRCYVMNILGTISSR